MRFCTNCKRINRGEPLFCNHCGSTYDIKVCRLRHQNARNAEYCIECGSREFSNPAPELSPAMRALGPILRYVPGAALTVVAMQLLWRMVSEFLGQPFLEVRLSFLIIFLTLCFRLYDQLERYIRCLNKVNTPEQPGPTQPNRRH